MLYGGNSYEGPNDDAPRVVDVFTNPQLLKVFEVGIARPRAMYVVYPFNGRDYLCRGAVLPYHEFAHATRLTDDEWRAMLDSDHRPALPEWVKPIYSEAGRQEPRLPKRE